jgi:RNA polymerase sigma factor (TIGR02999 family)
MSGPDVPLTQLLAHAAQGDRGALDRVFAALYPELRKIARGRLYRQSADAMLGTTTLVHETFLKLVGAERLSLADRKHFYAYAAKTMRNIIVDAARERHAERRGGGRAEVTLNTDIADATPGRGADQTLVLINDALLELEALDAELAQVVELRYFGGYGEAEIAELQGKSERTVRRQWEKARAFLLASLQE